MTEFEWKKQLQRGEVANLLRQVADGLERDGAVELEQDDWELKVAVAGDVTLGVELEVDGDESELEIELKWSGSASAAPADESSDAGESPVEIS